MSKGLTKRNVGLVRVLSLVRLLEQRGRWTLDDLAVQFKVTTRTIRRDLRALEDVGYPLGHNERGEQSRHRPGEWWLA